MLGLEDTKSQSFSLRLLYNKRVKALAPESRQCASSAESASAEPVYATAELHVQLILDAYGQWLSMCILLKRFSRTDTTSVGGLYCCTKTIFKESFIFYWGSVFHLEQCHSGLSTKSFLVIICLAIGKVAYWPDPPCSCLSWSEFEWLLATLNPLDRVSKANRVGREEST